jgi:glutathione S-transferase
MNAAPFPIPYRVIGIEASPYAVKVRAVFRYRRLPHVWIGRMPQFFAETQQVRPLIMPVVQFPDGEYRTDSTPILLDLEQRFPGHRSILPDDPGMAFLAALIEDFADEWLVKALFHYRFDLPEDQWAGARWVMDDAYPDADAEELARLTAEFRDRQVSRKPIVGCTPENAPLFETLYREVLAAMEGFVATDRFLFGSRPSLADFGLLGQLHTLASDPTPGQIMRETAPRTWNWVRRAHDLSGVEGEWNGGLSEAAEELLRMAGRWYLPFAAANAAAVQARADTVEVELDGHSYRQPPFRYQAACYGRLRAGFAALPVAARNAVAPVLQRTGCLALLD